MSNDVDGLSACELVDWLRDGEVSAEAVVGHYLDRIAERVLQRIALRSFALRLF